MQSTPVAAGREYDRLHPPFPPRYSDVEAALGVTGSGDTESASDDVAIVPTAVDAVDVLALGGSVLLVVVVVAAAVMAMAPAASK